jgi:predicted nucleotidyltransferase
VFYLDLFAALNRHQVSYVLIGGLAVALHGVERNTMDVDVCVVVSPDNLARLVAAAQELKLQPLLPVPLSALQDIETLQRWHTERHLQAFALQSDQLAGVTLDVLLFPPVAPEDMVQHAQRLDIGGVQVPLASIDDLIRLKQSAGRPIDLADIEHLQRLQTP